MEPTDQPATQPDDPDKVTLRIVQAGEALVTVDRGEYDEHVKDGGLEYFLVTAPARIPLSTHAIGPDGAPHDISLADPYDSDPIHQHFGLSYSTHMVLPRTLLQSMPAQWQAALVHLLDQYESAFQGVEQPPGYKVEAADEFEVSSLDEAQRKETGVIEDWYGGEEPPSKLGGEALVEWQAEHETDGPAYYDAEGNELDHDSRVMVRVPDPLPHYNRGRTRIAPRLVGE